MNRGRKATAVIVMVLSTGLFMVGSGVILTRLSSAGAALDAISTPLGMMAGVASMSLLFGPVSLLLLGLILVRIFR